MSSPRDAGKRQRRRLGRGRGGEGDRAASGFWVAMVVALGVYVLPAGRALSGAEAAYVVVTSAVTVALLAFAWLESRAHRDG